MVAAMLVSGNGLTIGETPPVREVQGAGEGAEAAGEVRSAGIRMPLVVPGTSIRVPSVVAETLNVPLVQRAEPVHPTVAQRIQRVADELLPCWTQLVSDVAVLRQPQQAPVSVPGATRSGFMTGITSLQKKDEGQLYSATNLAIRLYFFLPGEVIDGSGMDRRLRSDSIIPYAVAPVPKTYGDFLDWTVAHELWHVIDIQARLSHLLEGVRSEDMDLDRVLQDPLLWAREFQGVHVSELLGWEDYGESYAQGDELALPWRVTRGATSYVYGQGRFRVKYADGEFSFERQLVRTEYPPQEVQRLGDLAPLLKSGKYPTLYALFNTDEERFADYGAWFMYARLAGASERFAHMDPQLAVYYAGWWQAASERCRAPQPRLSELVGPHAEFGAKQGDQAGRHPAGGRRPRQHQG
jgi:hypothetical protein